MHTYTHHTYINTYTTHTHTHTHNLKRLLISLSSVWKYTINAGLLFSPLTKVVAMNMCHLVESVLPQYAQNHSCKLCVTVALTFGNTWLRKLRNCTAFTRVWVEWVLACMHAGYAGVHALVWVETRGWYWMSSSFTSYPIIWDTVSCTPGTNSAS